MELSVILGIAIPLVILIVDYFLGKTEIVKPNSTLETVLELAMKILEIFKDVKLKTAVKK